MFENWGGAGYGDEPPAAAFSVADVQGWITALAEVHQAVPSACAGDPDAEAARIDLIAVLERVKGAAAGAQAVLTADFAASQRAAQIAAGVPAARAGQGVGGQVALARRDSAFRGGRHVGLAKALTAELPGTLAALAAGDVSEWRATIVARETACLDADLRRAADLELARRIGAMSDGQVVAAARKVAYRLDPAGFLARTKGAAKHRRISLRPAPDTMSRLTGFLPVALGVAALAALRAHADTLLAGGDGRTRDQIMADAFAERLTGTSVADGPGVEIGLVMTDTTLFGDDDEPVDMTPEGGPVPAWAARAMLADTNAKIWIRRLFTDPHTATLTGMDSRPRIFPRRLRRFLILRDQVCRTPWCSAPIRHADHIVAHTDGGATTANNGQGLCAACNYNKQAPGWTAEPAADGTHGDKFAAADAAGLGLVGKPGHVVRLTTPTGHSYESHPPPLPRGRQPARAQPPVNAATSGRAVVTAYLDDDVEVQADADSILELRLAELLAAA